MHLPGSPMHFMKGHYHLRNVHVSHWYKHITVHCALTIVKCALTKNISIVVIRFATNILWDLYKEQCVCFTSWNKGNGGQCNQAHILNYCYKWKCGSVTALGSGQLIFMGGWQKNWPKKHLLPIFCRKKSLFLTNNY